MKKRELPHDLRSEKALIASLIINQSIFDDISDLKISENDFYDPRYAKIYKGIFELHSRNKPVDFVTVNSILIDLNLLETIGGSSFLTNIVDDHVTDANAYGYASIVKEKATLRRIILTSLEIANDGYDYEGHMKDFVTEVETKYFKLTTQSKGNKTRSINSLLQSNLKMLEDTSRGVGEIQGLSTGFKEMDKLLMGMRGGQLIIIGARPGMGKSALALNMAYNACEQSKLPVVIFSLEMGGEELSMRLLSSVSKVFGQKFKTKNFNPPDLMQIAKATKTIAPMPIFIDDSSATTLIEIMSICRKKKSEDGLGLVVIDYLQLMGVNQKVPREQQISEISRGLKNMAKDLDCPVIALSQLNRESEAGNKQGASKRPTSNNLRESGAIEQDADVIIMIYRDEFYNKDTKEPGVAEIIITKNRGGEPGVAKLGWVGAITSFEDRVFEQRHN